MRRIIVFGAMLGIAATAMAKYTGGFQARVTIEVVDEEGRPIPDARVGLDFNLGDPFPKGLTDNAGRFTAEGRTLGLISGGAGKEGYYGSWFRVDLDETLPKGVRVRRRYPDYTRRIVLRPIGNPVPMYAYEFHKCLPEEAEGVEVGFDFLKADWVAPYGKGETADVLICVTTFDPEKYDFHSGKIIWRFPRKGDGMVLVNPEDCWDNTALTMPRFAPAEGYEPNWWDGKIRGLRKGFPEDQRGPGKELAPFAPYFLRIRSELDEHGNLVKALYGKIIKRDYSIGWSPGFKNSPPTIAFIYYVNPDGTRNVEFDRKRNLFEGVLHPIEKYLLPQWP